MKKFDLPYQKWFWGDWFKAPDVQSLPREIRCTWFEMLGRMWESKERGYFMMAGRAPTDEEGAQLLGFGDNTLLYQNHINRLESAMIFSRDERGIIYSRRIINDIKTSEIKSIAGSKGMKNRWKRRYNKNITTRITDPGSDFGSNSVFVSEELRGVWGDFLEMRKTLKRPAPASIKAQKLIISELEKLAPGDNAKKKLILEQSIMNGWRGVFPLKGGQNGTNQNNPSGRFVGRFEEGAADKYRKFDEPGEHKSQEN